MLCIHEVDVPNLVASLKKKHLYLSGMCLGVAPRTIFTKKNHGQTRLLDYMPENGIGCPYPYPNPLVPVGMGRVRVHL